MAAPSKEVTTATVKAVSFGIFSDAEVREPPHGEHGSIEVTPTLRAVEQDVAMTTLKRFWVQSIRRYDD